MTSLTFTEHALPYCVFSRGTGQPPGRGGPRHVRGRPVPDVRRPDLRRALAQRLHEPRAARLAADPGTAARVRARRPDQRARPDRGRHLASAVRGGGLRRLLLLTGARDQRRAGAAARRSAAAPQLARDAGRLPRPGRHRGGQRHARAPPVRPARPRARPARAGAYPPAGLRGGARLRGGGRIAARPARPGRGVRRARVRRGAAHRLERAGHPGVRVPAAGAVPGQVLRDHDLAVGRPAGRAGAGPDPAPGPGPRAARLPAVQPALGPGHRPHGQHQRPGDLPAALRHHVLDRGAAARSPDRERRRAAHRRPVRLGHRVQLPPGRDGLAAGDHGRRPGPDHAARRPEPRLPGRRRHGHAVRFGARAGWLADRASAARPARSSAGVAARPAPRPAGR